MARPPSQQPTDGELEILKILWETGPAELGRICQAVRRSRPVATTTVATMLTVMLEKGLVKKTRGKRGYLWSAKVTREATAKRVLGKLLDRLFDGSARLLVSHLLTDERLSEADREEIARLLEADRKRREI
ncbi:MAG TPA: BlaI/MecI/CopY family transcriptional regulator [Phycisphaerae bacterium]|nr:BlaI/MecI/CopY family transcriptional regulator [Phycisphaerae bacterium]HPZ99177.1 BlaI/MecI/CopY family transcriptional regulator [Phycisphaerae bacterium]